MMTWIDDGFVDFFCWIFMGKVYRILFVWVGSEVLINRDEILCLIIKLSEHVGLYMYFAMSALDIFY